MPQIIHTADAGRPVVRVELANPRGVFATLDLEDFDRLVEQGHSTSWFLNGAGPYRYVRSKTTRYLGGNETVARVILGSPRGYAVSYLNGDRLDLRRANLSLRAAGRARGQASAKDEFYDPSRSYQRPETADAQFA